MDSALLRRSYVLFFIEIDTSVVHLGGITTKPAGPWTTQHARNLLMRLERKVRFVIHDGAGQYTCAFDDVFTAIDAEAIITPPGAPRANTYGNVGYAASATNCWTAPSSGTSDSCGHCSSST